jgi:Glycosyltransferase
VIKILFFIEELRGGGAEKVLCNLVNALDPEKFDVTVQTLWKADAAQCLRPGIRYRYCYGGKTAFNVRRSRLEAALGWTYPLHIKGRYDLEAAYLEFGSTKIMAGSTNRRAKKLAWVHCDLARNLSDPAAFVAKASKWYDKYDRVVCVSQTVRDSFVALLGQPEKTIVLYNTVDDAEIREKALAPLPEGLQKRRTTVVSVGRLSPEKQFSMLLSIHRQLLDSGLPHDLWILGEGPERPKLEALIRENRLADSVRLPGFCGNPYPCLRAADLLVCSSRFEGFSTFVTEGVILGKPIVTTDCSGMRELLGDSEYGLITENSEAALLEGMRNMLTNAGLREQYAARAAERGTVFSARQLTAQTEQFLLNLLEEQKQ